MTVHRSYIIYFRIADKEARAQSVQRKPGKRTKRWRKWAENYKALAAE